MAWRRGFVLCRCFSSLALAEPATRRVVPRKVLPLSHFIQPKTVPIGETSYEEVPYLPSLHDRLTRLPQQARTYHIETYGCQMNAADTDVLHRILADQGYVPNSTAPAIHLLVTCAIRENAEAVIWRRLQALQPLRAKGGHIGLLGCMAERLKTKLLEGDRLVDVVCGPDAYRSLPSLLTKVATDSEEDSVGAANVQLSADETYADIAPLSLDRHRVAANISIMRGCNNMCTYCIVPFTRGTERSRPLASILEEVRYLSDAGVKEITLLGQNVNSYRDTTTPAPSTSGADALSSEGFKTIYRKREGGLRFADLLHQVAQIDPTIRYRFTSPHPQYFPHELLQVIRDTPNIVKQVHLPAQSGNTAMLARMGRGYSREAYLELAHRIRATIPNVTLSSDFIVGFCGETEEEFAETLSLVEEVQFELAFCFKYSMREKTKAHRRYQDDVPDEVKKDRLARLLATYTLHRDAQIDTRIGQPCHVLVTHQSNKGDGRWLGRNEYGLKVALPRSGDFTLGSIVSCTPNGRHASTLLCDG